MRRLELGEEGGNGIDGSENLGVLEDQRERGVSVGPSTAADQREEACEEEKERLRGRTAPSPFPLPRDGGEGFEMTLLDLSSRWGREMKQGA